MYTEPMQVYDQQTPSITPKLFAIGFLIVITAVPVFLVWLVSIDRTQRQQDASASIGEEWGAAQLIAGPVLTVTTHQRTADTGLVSQDITLLPTDVHYDVELVPQTLSRGIYATPV